MMTLGKTVMIRGMMGEIYVRTTVEVTCMTHSSMYIFLLTDQIEVGTSRMKLSVYHNMEAVGVEPEGCRCSGGRC